MIGSFFSYFRSQPPSISVPVYPPYYEIYDKKGSLVGCLSGAHHRIAPNGRFEPAPIMQTCFDRATTLLVEADKEAVTNILRRELIQGGALKQDIDEHFQKNAQAENGIDAEWEKRAKAQQKPIQGLESPVKAINAAIKIMHEEEITPREQAQQCRNWTQDFLTGSDVKTQDYFHYCFINPRKTIPEFIERNEIMAFGIHQAVQSGNLSFATVGFGHCLGKKGVPQILKDRYGLDVKEIKPKPPAHVRLFEIPEN